MAFNIHEINDVNSMSWNEGNKIQCSNEPISISVFKFGDIEPPGEIHYSRYHRNMKKKKKKTLKQKGTTNFIFLVLPSAE